MISCKVQRKNRDSVTKRKAYQQASNKHVPRVIINIMAIIMGTVKAADVQSIFGLLLYSYSRESRHIIVCARVRQYSDSDAHSRGRSRWLRVLRSAAPIFSLAHSLTLPPCVRYALEKWKQHFARTIIYRSR